MEMLGRGLLLLHNVCHYRTFFTSMQVAIEQDQVDESLGSLGSGVLVLFRI